MKSTRSGMSHIIAETLRRDIITGKRSPGSALPQAKIAIEFDASHVPVREALLSLQADGLASYLPRKGASVSLMSKGDIKEIIDMRVELEGLALKSSMQAEEKIDFHQVKKQIIVANNYSELDVWYLANCSYHRNLYRACKMPKLLSTIEELWLHSERYLRAVWKTLDYQSKSQDEHDAILQKVERNDFIGAVKLLKNHIKQAGIELIKILPGR